MAHPLFIVDTFTDIPFSGNPAAVCVLSSPCRDDWMQRVAAELCLSETTFVTQMPPSIGLRWFTPTVEVDICGHGTLAAAHVLWELGILSQSDQATFDTRSGRVTAERAATGWIALELPADRDTEEPPPPGLVEALGVVPRYVGRGCYDYLVELDSEETVRSLVPDLGLLRTIPVDGVIVTSASSRPPYDFVSRYFAPRIGIDEDAVCGAAHCCLAPFWQRRLGERELLAYQASPRGGTLRVSLNANRVRILGQSVTVLRGSLLADS